MSYQAYSAAFKAWIAAQREADKILTRDHPCLDSNCCYRNPPCENCEFVTKTVRLCVGPAPDHRDYGLVLLHMRPLVPKLVPEYFHLTLELLQSWEEYEAIHR